ncbi:MAG: outer membrane protein/protective antigen [Holophagaceae bacterium]|nr:outer membrane protein/protective antigen [Holophagaceae bacterium]
MGLLRASLLSLNALACALAVAEPLVSVRYTGGGADDQAFARAAAGLKAGQALVPDQLEVALAAIRATDRFRLVSGGLEAEGGQTGCLIRLEPWPNLERWEWAGDCPLALRKSLFPELRKGIRVGEARREMWRSRAETQLRGSGYPEAKVSVESTLGGKGLKLGVELGNPALVKGLEITGALGPYSVEKLRKLIDVKPGVSLWHVEAARAARASLRERFLRDRRYEWKAELTFDPASGVLKAQVEPGPLVRLRILGSGLGWSRAKELLPLARAESYSPELLGEGERRILRLLRSRGYLDAQVSSSREILKASPDEVQVTYRIQSGPRFRLHDLRFEKNAEQTSAQLQDALAIPRRWLFFGEPLLTPDLISGLEDQIKGFYATRGYTDLSLRRPPMERTGEEATLVFQVREGHARSLRRLELRVAPEFATEAPRMAELLTASFADRPFLLKSGDPIKRNYRSDRPGLGKHTATLSPIPGEVGAYALDFSTPVPMVKRDLAQVLYLVHQRLVALGVQRPQEHLKLEEGNGPAVVRIDIPSQPMEQVRRLVVKGADRTRAEAFLRESLLDPGQPLDPERVVQTQSRVANLGAFERVELFSLSEDKPEVSPWKPGDLTLNVQERSPWVITNGFGYDRAQGYHFGTGVQRLNVGGMGRTVDFGLRAGDGTINNPWLRRVFPTGDSPRSVDVYSLGYTDPWFSPWSWLPQHAQLRMEGAYIFERRDAYEIRRQRITAGLEWRKGEHLLFQIGHRFEQANVKARADLNAPTVPDEVLNQITHSPSHSVISAPYFQVVRDTRDNPFDPTSGRYSVGRVELATQFLGTSPNSSFVKVDLRHQWTWPVGARARAGVAMLGLRLGMARPTASSAEDLPLSERFFGGGPFSQRGVQPDWLGPRTQVPMTTSSGTQVEQWVALGGQGLALVNAEYRFPILRPTFWGEVFVDSGQVYAKISDKHHDPFRTALGVGAILKIGFPIKIEYAVDLKQLLGKTRTQDEKDTQLKNLLISAGFQF